MTETVHFKTADSLPMSLRLNRKAGVPYLSFPEMEKLDGIRHMVSTRLGGVSQNEFSSMNLSYTRGDEPANVLENFRRVCAVLECNPEDIVATHQTHTKNIRVVTEEDRGCGVTREKTYTDVDGMITNVSGIVLCAYFADCVPILLADPVSHTAGIVHSGWKGTNLCISHEGIRRMKEEFGCRPENIHAAIGPSICRSCYEVSEDLVDAFSSEYVKHTDLNGNSFMENISEWDKRPSLFYDKGNGKYQLDLWLANKMALLSAGIPEKNIETTNICTCCNPELLFSHRASHGKRGNLCAFIGLK